MCESTNHLISLHLCPHLWNRENDGFITVSSVGSIGNCENEMSGISEVHIKPFIQQMLYLPLSINLKLFPNKVYFKSHRIVLYIKYSINVNYYNCFCFLRWFDNIIDWLNGHEFEQTLGIVEMCYSPWGHGIRHNLATEHSKNYNC